MLLFVCGQDLAARGIDVPLLNNVINFHFPPTPKLFIHRCGRAARQGRIGFAFSLVEPEELAYAMDVHLFLGKNYVNPICREAAAAESGTVTPSDGDENDAHPVIPPYNLSTMQPSMVHTGLLPQDCLDRESDFLRTAMSDDGYLATCWRICENAMKQYRRTRNEATKPGVKLAKEVTKKIEILHIHPLIMGCDARNCSDLVIEKSNFVKHLQTFRPAQTVFETGIGFGTGAQAIKGVNKKGSKEAHGADVMKALRRELRGALERSRPAASAQEEEEDEEESDGRSASEGDDGEADSVDMIPETDEFEEEDGDTVEEEAGTGAIATSFHADSIPSSGKPRLSKAARKKAKKNGGALAEETNYFNNQEESDTKGDFKDSKYYMSYGTENETKNYIESSLQPQSGLRTAEALSEFNMPYVYRSCF